MIVAGFGFRAGASEQSLLDAFVRASTDHLPQALATADDKADGLNALSLRLDLPVIPVGEIDLIEQTTFTQSKAATAARNTGSVAEASALAAAGARARLVAPRHISQDRMATCAIAIGDQK
ncbi:MAG: cobalamin biosynthesis protein [Paracoccaceae bacterium]